MSVPMTKTAQLAALILRHPGQRSAFYAHRLGMEPNRCAALIGTLMRRGWFEANVVPRTCRGRGGMEYRWLPSPKLQQQGYPKSRPYDAEALILNVLADGERVSITAMAVQLERSYMTIRKAVRRLVDRGVVLSCEGEKPTERLYYLATETEDDGWAPVPYVNPIRARALGLKGVAA